MLNESKCQSGGGGPEPGAGQKFRASLGRTRSVPTKELRTLEHEHCLSTHPSHELVAAATLAGRAARVLLLLLGLHHLLPLDLGRLQPLALLLGLARLLVGLLLAAPYLLLPLLLRQLLLLLGPDLLPRAV